MEQTEMKKEKSCGAIVFRKGKYGKPEILLIKHRRGRHWSFPKGHVEGTETERETALREVKEETGISITIFDGFRKKVTYSPKPGLLKDVVYFFAESKPNQELVLQKEEVRQAAWVDFKRAIKMVRFQNDKNLILEVRRFYRIKVEGKTYQKRTRPAPKNMEKQGTKKIPKKESQTKSGTPSKKKSMPQKQIKTTTQKIVKQNEPKQRNSL